LPTPKNTLPQSIALHIGAHKTASTHLQKTLWNNREMLSADGIRIFNPGYLRIPGRSLPSMFGLSWSNTAPPRRDAQEQLAFLAKGHKRLVFTEENFVGVLANKKGEINLPLYPSAVKRITELTRAWAPIKPQIFLGIRNPASFLASAYSQVLMGRSHVGPRAFRLRNDWALIDWADYVAAIRGIETVGDIFVWRQEDYETSQRLILRRMLRWKVGGKVDILPGRIHQGLSVNAVRQTLEWAKDKKEGPLAGTARGMHPISEANPAFQLYADRVFAEAKAGYDAQVERINAMEGVTVLHPPKAAQVG